MDRIAQAGSPRLPSEPWTEQEVTWTYRLGELSLFSVPFRLLVHRGHFSEVAPEPNGPVAPRGLVTSAVDGALMRSRPISKRLPRMAFVEGLLRYSPAQYRRYWVDMSGTFADYLAKFSSKSRSTLSRKVRRFQSRSELNPRWREYKAPDEIEEFYRHAREVSQKTYQEKLLDAGLPSDEAFHQELLRLSREGRVRGYILFLEDRPIAYLYCPLWRDSGIVLYRYLGYDPEFESLSPGTVLQYFALERLFGEEGVTMFDFLEGETAQKEFYSTDATLCADVFFLRCTPRNLVLVLGREMMEGVSDNIVRALAFLGIKRWMKRLFRRGAVQAVRGPAPRP